MIVYSINIRTATAEISVAKEVSELTVPILSASVSHRNPEIYNLYLDSDSKNMFLSDSVSLSDNVSFLIGMQFNEAVIVDDEGVAFLIDTSFSDSVAASEALSLSCQYNLDFVDNVTPNDNIILSFGLNLNDSVTVTDILDIEHTSPDFSIGGLALNEAAIQ